MYPIVLLTKFMQRYIKKVITKTFCEDFIYIFSVNMLFSLESDKKEVAYKHSDSQIIQFYGNRFVSGKI